MSAASDLAASDAWGDVVGQEAAVAMLRSAAGAGDTPHAWLFVGPTGSGKRSAARAFAGDLLARDFERRADAEGAARARALAHGEQHPDLIVVERVGASIRAPEAREIVKRASRSPVEGSRKVLVLTDFHLVEDAAPIMLKTIEEPPDGTFFLVLADDLPDELVTIASRCVRVDFAPLTAPLIEARLAAEGIAPKRAAEVAAFAGGDLGRARLLATDDRLALRLAAWRDMPRRLDGTGHAAARAIDELRAAIDDAEAPLKARQVAEVAELEERIERYGQRGSGAADLKARHNRETRRLRTDELRMGLGALAATYRDEMAVASDPSTMVAALEAIQETAERLLHNPNEELQLIALAAKLPTLG